MPLIRVADPFDDPDWIFELKLDGFRSRSRANLTLCDRISVESLPFFGVG